MELNYKKEGYGKKEDCGKVVSSTLPLCPGVNITPVGINGPLVAKIPVVLAEKDVQVDVEANIYLKKPLYEIKRIKKDVFLTQCKLIPRAGVIENNIPQTGKLFITGYVRKNIEYATIECAEDKGYKEDEVVRGEINHITVKVPFSCVTEVDYVVPPQVNLRGIPREIDLLCNHQGDCRVCEEEFIGRNLCEVDFEETVVYNEKPYCELVSARLFEEDIQRCIEEYKGETVYYKVIQKMVVFVRIKVLQLQQVNIRC